MNYTHGAKCGVKNLLAIVAASALSGCAQLLRVADGEAYYRYNPSSIQAHHPYRATKDVFDDWFLAPAKAHGWWGLTTRDPIGTAWLTIMWPGSLVDLPCETVCDTIMLVPDLILMEGAPSEKHQ